MAQPLSLPVAEHPTTSRPLVFPTDATVPESKEHLDLRTALYLVLCRELGARAWVGSDQFVYFDPSDPSKSVAPDLFVRLGGPDEAFESWKVWERGTPEVALEIVSESDAPPGEWEKKLAKYHAVGVLELLRFDAGATPPLRVWDRVDGDLVERRLDESRAASRVLLLDFVVRDGTLRLERKGVLLPTPDERAAAETARADRLRAKLLAAGIDPDDLSPHPRQKPPQLPPRHAQPPRWPNACEASCPCRPPPPRAATLACYRFPMAQPLSAPVDEHLTKPRPLVFPTEAQVPESKDHVLLRTALFLVLAETFADTAWIGSEQFVYYDASDPSRVVAPDVFLRRGGPDESFASWKVWERGCPELAIEIVSPSDASASAWEKKLARYHAVGITELVRFEAGDAAALRMWDRVDDDLIERRTDGRRATSHVLGCNFVVVGRALRVEREGKILPTPSERAALEADRAALEAERAAAETARAARLRAKLIAAGIDPDD